MTARPLWHDYSTQYWPMSGCLLNSGKFSSITKAGELYDDAVGFSTALHVGRSRFRFSMVSLEFFIDFILPVELCPGVDSASSRCEFQEYFPKGKSGQCVGLHVPIFLKSISLNLQESSGPE